MNRRASQGVSITRASMRNSFKYRRTSGTDGESGEPRLTRRIALLIVKTFKHETPAVHRNKS